MISEFVLNWMWNIFFLIFIVIIVLVFSYSLYVTGKKLKTPQNHFRKFIYLSIPLLIVNGAIDLIPLSGLFGYGGNSLTPIIVLLSIIIIANASSTVMGLKYLYMKKISIRKALLMWLVAFVVTVIVAGLLILFSNVLPHVSQSL